MTRVGALLGLLFLFPGVARAAQPLTIVNAGPRGELASVSEASEVRVVFSEPMVALGPIPDPVRAPFFSVAPAVRGSLRWSGTKTLIFTPARALPYGTKFTVTITGSATALSGNRLGKAYRFSFTTPRLKLIRTSWYRKSGKVDSPVVVVFEFNQPVRTAALAPHLSLAYVPHDWSPPALPRDVERWKAADPAGFQAYESKVAAARADARRSGVVSAAVARSWNVKWFPRNARLAVLETSGPPAVNTWLRARVARGARSSQGSLGSPADQDSTIRLEPAFFIEGFRCERACDPDEYNPIRFRVRTTAAAVSRTLQVSDVTDPSEPRPLRPSRKPASDPDWEMQGPLYPRSSSEEYPEFDGGFWEGAVAPEEAGYSLTAARTYSARVGATLRALDGQTLGYSWLGSVENWHQTAFTSFGSGHGVWEKSGGTVLPFSARNLRTLKQWLAPVKPQDLLGTFLQLRKTSFSQAPPVPGADRKLDPAADRIQFYGLEMKPALSAGGTGLLWAALEDGEPIARARRAETRGVRASLVQVTNLGISVKDSPQNTLVLVTRLDDARPVEGAEVSIRTPDGKTFWKGATNGDGIAVAPATALRNPENPWDFAFLVTAEKDGDVAYVASDWNEGVAPWFFNVSYDLSESKPLLRGALFTDRGVYRLGEEVHVKAVTRSDTAKGVTMLPRETPLSVVIRDSQGNEIFKRAVRLNEWSAADWSFPLPQNAPLGTYVATGSVEGQSREISGSFLVAAYRRPDFRVDVTLAAVGSALAGARLTGGVEGRYLFGAPMAVREARWTFSRRPVTRVPEAITDKFPAERWVFLDNETEQDRGSENLQNETQPLGADGKLRLELPTALDAGKPYDYSLEADVTDVSRQTLAGRAAFRVHPAPWYVGLKAPPYFAESPKGLDTEVLAVDPSGQPAAGVKVRLALHQIQWNSVRRAEGGGFYTWETERKEVAAGAWEVTSAAAPVTLHVPLPRGGYYVLSATARDAAGRSTRTATGFYALGAGYTAWERYDHNRIDLVPERQRYKPGETARILVKSPWETATALWTTEREGVRTQKIFTVRSTQETLEIPIEEADVPNLYVSVLLLKGRTASYTDKDASDPGKPAFRLGYVELKVEDTGKRLKVRVETDREEYRPAGKARVSVSVADAAGRGTPSELTFWAVDYGVLSLTGYSPPDLVDAVYVPKALQVLNEDSRQNIVSRRVIVPKGADEGGGGGAEDGADTDVRRDFRVLAFWLGSVTTDAQGRASTELTLPESLTTYRILAVAGDRASRFGGGQREIRVSKPVLLRPAFPRFLAAGDTASFGAVVHNQLAQAGTATVTMESLEGAVLAVSGETRKVLELAPGGSAEVAFTVAGRAPGEGRIRMTMRLAGESDAFEDRVPVRVLARPEVVAAHGQANPTAEETLELPAGVEPDVGGLRVDLSSTALVGLAEGARYLVEYPYGCAEQRASATLALMYGAELAEAFRLPGVDAGKSRDTAAAAVAELAEFQCEGGDFAFWKGNCATTSPYLTSWVLHVLQEASRRKYAVAPAALKKGYDAVERALAVVSPADEAFRSSLLASQAFAVKVLAEGGRIADSHATRLYGHRDRMPVFAVAYLADALIARGETGERREELLRRIRNAILPEGGSAHAQELSDPDLAWVWSSNVRTTAIVLRTLLRHGGTAHVDGLVRWLLTVRKRGRWDDTQENATALQALVDYFERREREVPSFTARVRVADRPAAEERFEGRSAEAKTREVPMRALLASGQPATRLPVRFEKEGTGILHYSARLTYLPDAAAASARDQGFQVERTYARAPEGGQPAAAAGRPVASREFQGGDLVRVTLTLRLPKERRFVAVTDPLPAGLEPVESWFATTASDLAKQQMEEERGDRDWRSWWLRGGFDHVERHDDRVLLFATRLSAGTHTFSYLARATTPGAFRVAPAHAEEMYEPEVFGRTSSDAVEVER
ncbi:MAG: MG2 domain-containing protein [Thermoanaerobaculia bacterium]